MKKTAILFLAFGVAAAGGCRDREQVETKIETETDRSGEIVRSEAEAAGRVPGGAEIDAEHKMFVGVVRAYKPGKSIEIETTDGDNQTFDLDERGTQVTIPASVKVGSKVEVLVDEQKDLPKKISVVPRA